jgi:hypothetical protein
MTSTVNVGTILIEGRPVIKKFLGLESEPCSEMDVVRGLDGFTLDRKIQAACWNFFFHGGRSQGDVLWSSRKDQDPECVATNSGEGEAQNFNCLEVTGIVAKRISCSSCYPDVQGRLYPRRLECT